MLKEKHEQLPLKVVKYKDYNIDCTIFNNNNLCKQAEKLKIEQIKIFGRQENIYGNIEQVYSLKKEIC